MFTQIHHMRRFTQMLIAPSDFLITKAYCNNRVGGGNKTAFLFAMKTGPDSPLGIYWKTKNLLNHTEIVESYLDSKLEGPQGSYTERNKEYEQSFCIEDTSCFLLTIVNLNVDYTTDDLLKYPGAFEVKSDLPIRRVMNGSVTDDSFRSKPYRFGSDATPYYDDEDNHLYGGGPAIRVARDCRFVVDQYVIGNDTGLCTAEEIIPIINEFNKNNMDECEKQELSLIESASGSGRNIFYSDYMSLW